MIGTVCGHGGLTVSQADAIKTIASNPFWHWVGQGDLTSLTIYLV